MRTMFFEFFEKTNEDYKDIWANGIFAFDANILLNLHRYSEQTRNDFFSIMERLEAQVWLPYQAAYEYLKNRRTVIFEKEKYYTKLLHSVKSGLETFKRSLEQHRLKKNSHFDMDSFLSILQTKEKELCEQIEAAKTSIASFDEDGVLNKIEKLFANKIGQAFEEKQKEKHSNDAEKRFKDKIPPGYKDEKKPENKYGDYFLWVQMIDYSKTQKKPFIFITDDEKSDWWQTIEERTMGLLPPLIKEFKEKTEQHILIYNSSFFIKTAQQMLNIQINENSFQEVESVNSSQKENAIEAGLTTVQPGELHLSGENVSLEVSIKK